MVSGSSALFLQKKDKTSKRLGVGPEWGMVYRAAWMLNAANILEPGSLIKNYVKCYVSTDFLTSDAKVI